MSEYLQRERIQIIDAARVEALDIAIEECAVRDAVSDMGVIAVIARKPEAIVEVEQQREAYGQRGDQDQNAAQSRRCQGWLSGAGALHRTSPTGRTRGSRDSHHQRKHRISDRSTVNGA